MLLFSHFVLFFHVWFLFIYFFIWRRNVFEELFDPNPNPNYLNLFEEERILFNKMGQINLTSLL